MKRIIIIGPSGAGKSTLSSKLGDILNIPVYHLDNIWWNSDKTHITRDEFDLKLDSIIKDDKWIIDGDFSRTYEVRMEACDTIIFLDYSLDVCLSGVANRVGSIRSDIPWVEDELDSDFILWIKTWFKEGLPKTKELLEKYKDFKDIIVFHNRDEANKYLEDLKKCL